MGLLPVKNGKILIDGISEYTKTIPKPMIKIGNKPILIHIIEHYSKYGHKDFLLP